MNIGWVGEITPAKLLRLLLEIGLDQGNLGPIGGIVCCHGLETAILQGLEHVHGLFEIERHDLGTLGSNLLLTAGRCTKTCTVEKAEQGESDEHHGHHHHSSVVLCAPKTLLDRHTRSPYGEVIAAREGRTSDIPRLPMPLHAVLVLTA